MAIRRNHAHRAFEATQAFQATQGEGTGARALGLLLGLLLMQAGEA